MLNIQGKNLRRTGGGDPMRSAVCGSWSYKVMFYTHRRCADPLFEVVKQWSLPKCGVKSHNTGLPESRLTQVTLRFAKKEACVAISNTPVEKTFVNKLWKKYLTHKSPVSAFSWKLIWILLSHCKACILSVKLNPENNEIILINGLFLMEQT